MRKYEYDETHNEVHKAGVIHRTRASCRRSVRGRKRKQQHGRLPGNARGRTAAGRHFVGAN